MCEEFIQMMGQKVLDEIIAWVKQAKYFSNSVDSTPDYIHVDQLTVILWFVTRWLYRGALCEILASFKPHWRSTVPFNYLCFRRDGHWHWELSRTMLWQWVVGVISVSCWEDSEQFFCFVQTLFNLASKSTSHWQMIKAGLQANDSQRIETLKHFLILDGALLQPKPCVRITLASRTHYSILLMIRIIIGAQERRQG